jgi:hypothetical protein
MANLLAIPFLNPVSFYEAKPAVFDEYLTKFMHDYPFEQNQFPWLDPLTYRQKWQTSDTIYVQVESNFEPLQLDLINRYGNVVLSLVANLQMPNKYMEGVHVYEFALSLASVEEGCYHLRLTTGNLNELNMISEPMEVRDVHEGTILMQYRNSRYHGDVIFETGITFGFRVEGAFDFLDPGANITAYEDQKADPYILSARPYRVWPLVIGGEENSRGIPDWVVDKFNLIWSCNDVKVDGKSFARNGDAQLSFQVVEGYRMRGITLPVREGQNRGSKIVSPTVDTNKKLLVSFNINTKLFGDISENAANNLIPITQTY